MSMKDCIEQAVAEGRLSREKADETLALYDEIAADLSNTMHADAADIEAARRTYEAAAADTAARRRQKLLQVKTWQRIDKNMQEYRDARGRENYGAAMVAHLDADATARFSNLESRRKTILGRLHGRMDGVLAQFRRNLIGGVRERATLDDLVREAFGVDTGNAAAKDLARAWSDTAEWARMRFNAAGGRIPKRADWGMPQSHDAVAVARAGYEVWRDFIMPRLDPARMMNEQTGLPFTREQLELALRDVHETISSEGMNKVVPGGATGRSSLANRRLDRRFLVFKNPDMWLEYNARFGQHDPFSAMMAHLDGMARDIAALETLGPNPTATLLFMEQSAMKWGGNAGRQDAARRAVKLSRDIYSHFTGGANAPIDGRWGRGFAGLRQVLQAAQLGGAAISSITDLNTGRMARAHAGLPQVKMMGQIVKLLNPADLADQKLAVRLGLIAENWASVAAGQARYVGDMAGPEISRRVSDVVMRISGLSPWTQAGRWAFGMEFMGFLADHAAATFRDLPPALQRTMKKYGLSAEHWDVMRMTDAYEHEGVKFLRPEDIASRTDLAPSFADDLGMKLLEMIQSETEFAVPSGSLRGRAALISDVRPGTLQGELLRSFAMYKSFAVTLFNTHIMRMVTQKGHAARARYAAELVISTTLMGALAIQMKELAKGRDPRPMAGDRASEFWGAALMQGGGLGIFGDFLGAATTNRFGGGLAETLAGPVAGFVNDAARLTIGNAVELAQGKDTKAGAELVNFLRRYTPGAGVWYYAQAAQRMIFDEIQKAIDPDALERFRRQEQKYRREQGQRFWWRPGRALPDRAPNLSNAMEEQ